MCAVGGKNGPMESFVTAHRRDKLAILRIPDSRGLVDAGSDDARAVAREIHTRDQIGMAGKQMASGGEIVTGIGDQKAVLMVLDAKSLSFPQICQRRSGMSVEKRATSLF